MYEVTDGKKGHRLSKGMSQNPDGSMGSKQFGAGGGLAGKLESHPGVKKGGLAPTAPASRHSNPGIQPVKRLARSGGSAAVAGKQLYPSKKK